MNHDRLESIAGIIAGGFIPTGQRHPIVRSGERRPIAQHVRTAVWYRCRVLTGYRRIHEMTGEVPTWHQRPLIREPFVVAFCAHCGAPALTDLPL